MEERIPNSSQEEITRLPLQASFLLSDPFMNTAPAKSPRVLEYWGYIASLYWGYIAFLATPKESLLQFLEA